MGTSLQLACRAEELGLPRGETRPRIDCTTGRWRGGCQGGKAAAKTRDEADKQNDAQSVSLAVAYLGRFDRSRQHSGHTGLHLRGLSSSSADAEGLRGCKACKTCRKSRVLVVLLSDVPQVSVLHPLHAFPCGFRAWYRGPCFRGGGPSRAAEGKPLAAEIPSNDDRSIMEKGGACRPFQGIAGEERRGQTRPRPSANTIDMGQSRVPRALRGQRSGVSAGVTCKSRVPANTDLTV
jgi:hypothetical protein